jgi:hypothetical protein
MQETLIYKPNSPFANYRPVTVIHKQDAEATKPNLIHAPELSLFWVCILMIALLPMGKSAIFNGFILARNFTNTINLGLQEHRLLRDTNELSNKISEAQSQSGLVRSIKEEIKAIGKNEILIRIVK